MLKQRRYRRIDSDVVAYQTDKSGFADIQGQCPISPGTWVVKDQQGRLSSYSPAQFVAKFQEITDGEAYKQPVFPEDSTHKIQADECKVILKDIQMIAEVIVE